MKRWPVLALLLLGAGLFGLDRWLRVRTAREIQALGPALARGDLTAACRLTALRERWGAQAALAPLRRRILALLRAGLQAPNPAQAARAAEALVAWGKPAVPYLRSALEDPAGPVRLAAAAALAFSPLPELRKPLRAALRDHRPAVRLFAAEALGRLPPFGDEEVVADLAYRLWNDTEPLVQNAAAEALYRHGNWLGLPILVRNLGGLGNPTARYWSRRNAYERLRRLYRRRGRWLPPYDADAHLLARLEAARRVTEAVVRDPELPRRILAGFAAYKALIMTATRWTVNLLGPAMVPHLGRALADPRPLVRFHAAQALADLGDPAAPAAQRRRMLPYLRRDALPLVRRALPRSDARTGAQLLRALGYYGTAADVDRIARFLAGPDPDLVLAAVRALHDLGLPEARRRLEAAPLTGEADRARREALRTWPGSP